MSPPVSQVPKQDSAAVFTTTHWSVVLSAAAESSPTGRDALEFLCSTYWPPLYAYARRVGNSPQDAQDLTQGFFLWLIEKGTLATADPDRGRFRSFLLGLFKHFIGHEASSTALMSFKTSSIASNPSGS
jgi:RNA polymerase sigma-70 factor (ECF subfamily)